MQSDSIMIVSINNETNDVTMTSVYRDTLLQQADGSYEKANSAYNRGGPEAAISLLNRNFDLDSQLCQRQFQRSCGCNRRSWRA